MRLLVFVLDDLAFGLRVHCTSLTPKDIRMMSASDPSYLASFTATVSMNQCLTLIIFPAFATIPHNRGLFMSQPTEPFSFPPFPPNLIPATLPTKQWPAREQYE